MLSFLPAPLIGVINALLLGINTLFWCLLLLPWVLLKLVIPVRGARVFLSRVLIWISESWVACNTGWMKLTHNTDWQVTGADQLKREGWYLVMSNHQSWVDILAMQRVLNHKAPFLKFFLKKELIWVPVIGLAWWALDFPFMKRHSREYLIKHPEKRGEDLKATRKACEKFRDTPVSVMNFVEGTRFTPAKHKHQKSPYKHLLVPKAGGVGFVLDAMGDSIQTLVDVTIAYPGGSPTFWDFLCGRMTSVKLHIDTVAIPEDLKGKDYSADGEQRRRVKDWLAELWSAKDQRLDDMLR
ncbi:acyltransferase [Marinobacter zhejiangensis]|uniref:1-acyl-sn-glycerol-3-phosphate acyltransferases n=1 Tax=Marinobacter zhejiangensis TaxID=488535 RepID=A0A1I4LGM5_9GAMM|nr:acyltransferase [Marinobacter zhejiangensis]SFL89996.1 1-acyl-sn-glycerol-3-phosphate acyltransferases [Marinobacter zhejiangensis]